MSAEAQQQDPVPMEAEASAPPAAAKKNPDADPRLKSIRIKTGSVKRLAKDVLYYEKELGVNTAKVEKMKEEGKDAKEVAHWEEIRNETVKVIPDVKRKLKEAFDDLKNILDSEPELKEEELYKAAEAALNDASALANA